MEASRDVRGEIRRLLLEGRARAALDRGARPSREELALLTGLSQRQLGRLEEGDVGDVSDDVIGALSRALQLSDLEHARLLDLIHLAGTPAAHDSPGATGVAGVRPSVRQLLDALTDAAAIVHNARLDVLAANPLGRALYSPVFDGPTVEGNLARFVFVDPASGQFYRDWDRVAAGTVASLRAAADRAPGDRRLSALIDELSTRSEQFRRRWAAHDEPRTLAGRRQLRHPIVGDLDLDVDVLEVQAEPGQAILVHTAAPDSDSGRALNLLGHWTTARRRRAREPGADADTGASPSDPTP